jgi:hypothetical protein
MSGGCRDIRAGVVKEATRRGLTGVSWGMLARFASPATMRSDFRNRACDAFRRRGSRRKAKEQFEPLSRRARSPSLSLRHSHISATARKLTRAPHPAFPPQTRSVLAGEGAGRGEDRCRAPLSPRSGERQGEGPGDWPQASKMRESASVLERRVGGKPGLSASGGAHDRPRGAA